MTTKLPRGFKAHDGGECPVDPESYVEPLIMTSEGVGSGGVGLASAHDWVSAHHENGLGAVLAYRPAKRGEMAHFGAKKRWEHGKHPTGAAAG